MSMYDVCTEIYMPGFSRPANIPPIRSWNAFPRDTRPIPGRPGGGGNQILERYQVLAPASTRVINTTDELIVTY